MVKKSVHIVTMLLGFAICAVLVIFFIKGKVDAQTVAQYPAGTSANNDSGITSATQASAASAVNGVCYYASGVKLLSAPVNLCAAGQASDFEETASGWSWKCAGINSGDSVLCNVSRIVASSDQTTATGQSAALDNDAINSAASALSENIINESVSMTKQGVKDMIEQNKELTDNIIEGTSDSIGESLKTIQKAAEIAMLGLNTPAIIDSKNLQLDENPKTSGTLSNELTIDNVNFQKIGETASKILLSGKAQPDSFVRLYIFSENPIVINVKADQNGIWNYELDKELDNGQHEVYLAVTDNEGKIVSKSQPVAFIKTAEAASMVPISELEQSKAPMQKTQKQYAFMAIVIIVICLGLALALIGVSAHKKRFDNVTTNTNNEGTN